MDIEDSFVKPFTMAYVLRTTFKHQRKAIDVSIRKTFERIKDFEEDSPKAREIFNTLAFLHKMRNDLDEFQRENKSILKGE